MREKQVLREPVPIVFGTPANEEIIRGVSLTSSLCVARIQARRASECISQASDPSRPRCNLVLSRDALACAASLYSGFGFRLQKFLRSPVEALAANDVGFNWRNPVLWLTWQLSRAKRTEAVPSAMGHVSIWSTIILCLVCLLSADSLAFCQDAELKVEPVRGVAAEQVEAEPKSESSALGESSTETAEVELTESDSLRIRLICFAFFGGFVLAFLALLFSYLRLDHATRGFHSGRLQLAAIALTAVVLIVGYLLWTQVLFK